MHLFTTRGPLWLVTGTHGMHVIRAAGRTQSEAWYDACELAAAADPRGAGTPGGRRRLWDDAAAAG